MRTGAQFIHPVLVCGVAVRQRGPGHYSAANAYLDELARWRTGRGLPGVSIQWPAVSGVGMAAVMDEQVRIDSKLSVNVRTVKQVVSQLLDMKVATRLAVQGVVPRGLLEEGVFRALWLTGQVGAGTCQVAGVDELLELRPFTL